MSETSLPARDLTPALVDSLYLEAMLLAEEARDHFGNGDINAVADAVLSPSRKVELSCESLKVTTRLMHSIAWLLNRKAYFAGELTERQLRQQQRLLGRSSDSDPAVIASLDPQSRYLVHASQELFARLQRLEDRQIAQRDVYDSTASGDDPATSSPARAMQQRLRASLI